ncbi:hypothetical protein FX155_07040 [Acidaminococcus fermentans]|uniref:YopX protein domain-containing protein n=1 Tax=Acidaminococcus fermentans TaxID=905 RepID=A0A6N7W2A6_ACIFE|nr:YopX family protein [Acidaminococcus fermentans]MSS82346.1 hypothetical protein [Acidaminococcus fermentans]
MRTIRFRGWSYEKEGWVYGDLKHVGESGTMIVDKSNYRYVVQPQSVGQYTGFTTKTAGDIYEGDILNSDDENLYLVMWDEESGQWCVVAPDDPSIGNALEDEVANAELIVVGTEYEAECLGRAPWKEEEGQQ